MTTAVATADYDFQDEVTSDFSIGGAQGLLLEKDTRPSFLAGAAALLAYALLLTVIVTYKASPQTVVEEQPLELVLEMPPSVEPPAQAPPTVEPPPPEPPVAEETPPEEVVQEPPPPMAVEPEPVAPVEPPKPLPPKKVEVKKVEKKVEHKPVVAQQRPTSASPAAPDAGGAPASSAMASNYANLVQARVARAAANSYPRAAMASGANGRVPYRIVIGPSGELISKNISPTGNSAFDMAAAEALSRAAPFPPSGASKAVSLSGAIVYRLH